MKRKEQSQWKTYGFIALGIALILLTTLSIVGTVQCKERDRYKLNNPYIKEQEEECVKQIKMVLEEQCCKNSGITMTKTIEKSGDRQYRILIHHDRINRMTCEEKEELKRNLENIGFAWENYSIYYEFLP